jgi:hypothetical protein
MNDNRDNETRQINCPALRTLHTLERTLRRHIDELMQIGCEDAEAAEAIVFAIEAAEKALEKTRVTRREINEA